MASSPIIFNPSPSPPTISHTPKPNHSSSIPISKSSLQSTIKSLEHYSLEGKQAQEHQAFFSSIISTCISTKALHEANDLRAHMARIGYDPGLFLDNQFINLYSKCGQIEVARKVFDDMSERNVVSWNVLISGYCSNECYLDALELFCNMVEEGQWPNDPTLLGALRAAAGSRNIEHGRQIHSYILKMGFLSCISLGNALIGMYSKFCRTRDAELVFESMAEKDAVSWNSIIAAKAQNGLGVMEAMDLFVEMLMEGLPPDDYTFGSLLANIGVPGVEEIHAQVIKRGLGGNVVVGSTLLDAYARCLNPQDACQVFKMMEDRNTVAWNSVISACLMNGMENEGLELYLQMADCGILADAYTVSILLTAAAVSQWSVITGKQLHGLAVKMGLHMDTLIGNSLITMYAKNGEISDSWQAFKSVSEADIISWNSIVHAHLQNEQFEQALALYVQMKVLGFEPDEFSFVAALAACGELAWCNTGRGIHSNLVKIGMTPNAFVGSALIGMYSKFTATTDAKRVFDAIEDKDLVTWNSLISGFAQNGYVDEVLKLLSVMREENFEPDDFTFASILAACANTITVEHGRQVHCLILKSDQKMDAAVANALITMYSRAGREKEAEKVFSKLTTKNVISWTAMIGAYVQCGNCQEAFRLFEQMETSGVTPNEKTFITILSACSYTGKSKEAEKYFKLMKANYGIRPGFDHCACMVDVLGRAGRLQEAEEFIERMPYKPSALVWKMLLSACRVHGDIARGKRSMEKIMALDPSDSAAYVLLSNLYASFGYWDSVMEVRQLMRDNGVKKEPGKSWIQVHNKAHEFVAGDHSHPQTDEIYATLRELLKQMKAEGYIPGVEFLINT
ncbi:pentatricopeptide repeat-containing protein At3g09040, mitochondrial-like [Dioscorea cayenensis subsp. rotundata]|uniref:Pentatricopeptide repeat-containing protein At3g09040, mitochondrial-like n=1 Tax=Dioscorea cayennensis subsp. rotundata TaxID=55577 RepID=A0AB40CIZ4_DIOCR|nr:pentatricopeptide repeat-containing protein At3g09040, mitochondrial-like [Dioscorea cayenensis subsp. rotundata]